MVGHVIPASSGPATLTAGDGVGGVTALQLPPVKSRIVVPTRAVSEDAGAEGIVL
jgi:hypothetical protein